MNKSAKSAHSFLFIEHRSAPLWTLITSYVFSASLAVALYPRIGLLSALFVGVLMSLSFTWFWRKAQSSIKLDDIFLHVGRAKIERHWISEVDVLDKHQFLNRIRTEAALTDYFALRNLDYGGVVLHIADESDPHKHWVISMKQGTKLKDQLIRGHHV